MKTLQTISVCSLVLVVFAAQTGCHRSFYRRQADVDANRLIQEKSLDPHWSLPNYTIEVDPRSRMFDPFSLDHPPMPADDPSAAEFMDTVDGKPGFPHWHANGDTPYVANPEWEYMLPLDEDGKLKVNLDQALELALIHSPEYQRQMETLYLSALDVSLERFDFESQLFAPFNSALTSDGRIRGGGSSSTQLLADNGAGMQLRKAGITGSTLVVAFANSLLWEYSGSDSTVGFGALSFELIQPLLRNAGRDVIMESLTDAERGLLYNVRQLERFRRGFSQQIVAGISPGNGVSRGSGSFASVGGVSSNAGGMLGLLQTQQNIRIQEGNIASQRTLIEQFEEFFRSERINLLQLTQFRNNLYNSESGLLAAKIGYQNSLDDFKIQLGLPPQLEIEINDPILDQFVLIDDKITERQGEIGQLRNQASDLFVSITELISSPNVQMKVNREEIIRSGGSITTDLSWTGADVMWTSELNDRLKKLRETLEQVNPVYDKIFTVDFEETAANIKALESSIEKRRASLDLLKDNLAKNGEGAVPAIEPEILDSASLESLVKERLLEFQGGERVPSGDNPMDPNAKKEIVAGVKKSLERSKEELGRLLKRWDLIIANEGLLPKSVIDDPAFQEQVKKDPELAIAIQSRAGTIKRFISEPGPEILTSLNNQVVNISLIQALARVDTLALPIVNIGWKEALDVARENRRDWMNARGQLVDRWRNIEIVANDLESQLDLTFSGDLQNVGNNPTRLRDSNGRIRVGLQFDAPITRLAERNSYREAQILYQQAKRTYYQYEDQVAAQLREIIRRLEVAKLNFELSRRQVKNAVDQVQLASYELIKPPQPGSNSSSLGSTVARDLIQALSDLQSNQSNLIRDWVNYEVLRRQLDLNMGTMQLDENGFWIDPIEITAETVRGAVSGDVMPGGLAPNELVPNGIAPRGAIPEGAVPNGAMPNTISPQPEVQLNPMSSSGSPIRGDRANQFIENQFTSATDTQVGGIYDRNIQRRSSITQPSNLTPKVQRESADFATYENGAQNANFVLPVIEPTSRNDSVSKTGRLLAPATKPETESNVSTVNKSKSKSSFNGTSLYNSNFDSDRKRGSPHLIPPFRRNRYETTKDSKVKKMRYQENSSSPPRIAPIPASLKEKTKY